jgi:hypothetical protein
MPGRADAGASSLDHLVAPREQHRLHVDSGRIFASDPIGEAEGRRAAVAGSKAPIAHRS